jgi:hypothetical protein
VNDLDLSVRLMVAKLTFMACLELAAYAGGVEAGGGNLQRPLLADIAQIEAALECQIGQSKTADRQAGFRHHRQFGKTLLNGRDGIFVQRLQPGRAKILADIGAAHAEGAEHAGTPRHINRRTTQRSGDRHGVKRTGAAACDQRETPRIMPALDADALDGVLQALVEQPDDAGCRRHCIEPEFCAEIALDRRTRKLGIKPDQSVGESP